MAPEAGAVVLTRVQPQWPNVCTGSKAPAADTRPDPGTSTWSALLAVPDLTDTPEELSDPASVPCTPAWMCAKSAHGQAAVGTCDLCWTRCGAPRSTSVEEPSPPPLGWRRRRCLIIFHYSVIISNVFDSFPESILRPIFRICFKFGPRLLNFGHTCTNLNGASSYLGTFTQN